MSKKKEVKKSTVFVDHFTNLFETSWPMKSSLATTAEQNSTFKASENN